MTFVNWRQCYLLLNILLWSDCMSIWLSSCSLCILSCFIYVVIVRGYQFLNAELCWFRKVPDLIERLKVPSCFSQREIICTCTFLFISEKFDSFIHNVLKSRVVEQKNAINSQIIVYYYYYFLFMLTWKRSNGYIYCIKRCRLCKCLFVIMNRCTLYTCVLYLCKSASNHLIMWLHFNHLQMMCLKKNDWMRTCLYALFPLIFSYGYSP